MLLERRLERSTSLQFSLFGHTLDVLLVDSYSPSRSRPGAKDLKGWSWLSIAVPMSLEKWFRLTDLAVDHHHRG